MRKLIIFGVGEFAEVADYYFSNHTGYEVVAFTVDARFLASSSFIRRPVIPFEELELHYTPADADIFIAIGYSKLNSGRVEKVSAAERKGFRLASYLSEEARVWKGFQLGRNCFILEQNILQPFSRVGDNVVLWCGNHVGHHSVIGDHCYIAGHVLIAGHVVVGSQCFFGSAAIIRDHITVGERTIVGMGTLLLHDAAAHGVYAAKGAPRSPVPSSRLGKL